VEKQGYVYFIKCRDKIKIGYSTNVNKRLKQFSVGNGEKLELIYKIQTDRYLESVLHKKYQNYHISGEWFEAEPIIRMIEQRKRDIREQKKLGLIK